MKMKHYKPSGNVDLTNWELGPDPRFYKHFEKIVSKIEKSLKKIEKDLEAAQAWNFQDKLMVDISESVDYAIKADIDFDIIFGEDNELFVIVNLPIGKDYVEFRGAISDWVENVLSTYNDEDGLELIREYANALRKLADKIDKIAKK